MSLCRFSSVLLVLTAALVVPSFVSAQIQDAPKVEVFGGYSWYHAGGTVKGVDEPDFNKGWAGQFTYNLSHFAGLTVDGTGHSNDVAQAHTITVGPQFKLRHEHSTPFFEALLGIQKFAPKTFASQIAPAFVIGGGLDLAVNRRLSIRPFQVDFINSYYDKLSAQGQANTFNGVRLQAGLVFNFGVPSQESSAIASADCSAEPHAVDVGAPITVSVTPNGFQPNRALSYSYASTGGKIDGTTSSTALYTAGMAPGSYTVSAQVSDNRKGRHHQSTSCEAAFVINEQVKHPPVLSVSASPASLISGESATITANGSSPDGRPLDYQCSATAGKLTGSGLTYTLDTTGVPDSTVGVKCTVKDDRALTVSASAAVVVKSNVVAQAPSAKHIHAIEFKNDLRRPTRVDNQAKGELDRYADALASEPDAKGVLVGYATVSEKLGSVTDFASQRAVNSKDYLTKDKGIDPARIETRTGGEEDRKVELWIVPAGATFQANGTVVVDEAKVKAIPRIAARPHKKAHKKAHKRAVKKN